MAGWLCAVIVVRQWGARRPASPASVQLLLLHVTGVTPTDGHWLATDGHWLAADGHRMDEWGTLLLCACLSVIFVLISYALVV